MWPFGFQLEASATKAHPVSPPSALGPGRGGGSHRAEGCAQLESEGLMSLHTFMPFGLTLVKLDQSQSMTSHLLRAMRRGCRLFSAPAYFCFQSLGFGWLG